MKKSPVKSEDKLPKSNKIKITLGDLFQAQKALENLVSNVANGKICNKINDLIIEIKAANQSYRKTVDVKNAQGEAFKADILEKYNPRQYDVKTEEGKKELEKANVEMQSEITHEINAINIEINRAGLQEVEIEIKSPKLHAKEIYDWTLRPMHRFDYAVLTEDYLAPFLN